MNNKVRVLEVASNQMVIRIASKMLIDFGAKVTRVGKAKNIKYIDERLEKWIQEEFISEKNLQLVDDKHVLIIHEDHIRIQNIVKKVLERKKDIIVIIVHRVSQQFKQKIHDAQILALSGLLSHFGQADGLPQDNLPQAPPMLSSLVSAVSLVTRIFQAVKQKQNGLLRFSMLHSVMYLGCFHLNSYLIGLTQGLRGTSMLQGGAPFYRIYQTKNSYLCIGNIQTKFYSQMIKGLSIDIQTAQYLQQNQMNIPQWSKMIRVLQQIFKSKTTQQWIKIMSNYDTCITPIYNLLPRNQIQPYPKLSKHPLKQVNPEQKIVPKL